MDVTIDKETIVPPAQIATWGDLLEWIETKQLKPGRCITRVLFHGQEELEYRKTSVCSRDIRNVGQVYIESGEFDVVVEETFSELEAELLLALENTRDIIRKSGQNSEEHNHDQLAHLLDSVRMFFSVFSEDLGWVDAPDMTASLESAIQQLSTAQENRSWMSIGDVLQAEIIPTLESWLKTVGSTRAKMG